MQYIATRVLFSSSEFQDVELKICADFQGWTNRKRLTIAGVDVFSDHFKYRGPIVVLTEQPHILIAVAICLRQHLEEWMPQFYMSAVEIRFFRKQCKSLRPLLLLMDKILHHLGWLKPYIYINNGIFIMLGGAGFCPSTVSWESWKILIQKKYMKALINSFGRLDC